MLWHSSAPSGIFTQEFLFCSFQRYLWVSGEWMRFIFCKPKENLKHLSWDYEINQQAFNLRQKYKRSVWKRRQERASQISLFKTPTWCSKAQYLIGIPLSNVSSWGSVIVRWVMFFWTPGGHTKGTVTGIVQIVPSTGYTVMPMSTSTFRGSGVEITLGKPKHTAEE